jgi:hypothetical protein
MMQTLMHDLRSILSLTSSSSTRASSGRPSAHTLRSASATDRAKADADDEDGEANGGE